MSSMTSLKNRDLSIELLGTRGSVAVSGPSKSLFGGHTTCARIHSSLLPPRTAFFIDMGTGIVEGGERVIDEWGGMPNLTGDEEAHIFATHVHWDHIIGLSLTKLTFAKKVKKIIWGPTDKGKGPKDVIDTILDPPYFPVSSKRVKSAFHARPIDDPAGTVIICHPKGGFHRISLDRFEKIEASSDKQVKFPGGAKYGLNTCLVIKMVIVSHPDRTVSFRIENRVTGEVIVFCTDHEDQAHNSMDLKNHCRGADVLIMDAQYTTKKYKTFASGFGHATGPYAVRTALETGAKSLGLTHHDPEASDMALQEILSEARDEYKRIVAEQKELNPTYKPSLEDKHDIFLCSDSMLLSTEDPKGEAIKHLQASHAAVKKNMDDTEGFLTSEHLAIVGGSNQAA